MHGDILDPIFLAKIELLFNALRTNLLFSAGHICTLCPKKVSGKKFKQKKGSNWLDINSL